MRTEPPTMPREYLVATFAEPGALVEAVSSAKEAYDRLSHRRPDVLVSDIGMPDEDGYSLIRRVREMPGNHKVPAIALTAYARKQENTLEELETERRVYRGLPGVAVVDAGRPAAEVRADVSGG